MFSQFAAEVVFPEAFWFRSGDLGLDLGEHADPGRLEDGSPLFVFGYSSGW